MPPLPAPMAQWGHRCCIFSPPRCQDPEALVDEASLDIQGRCALQGKANGAVAPDGGPAEGEASWGLKMDGRGLPTSAGRRC